VLNADLELLEDEVENEPLDELKELELEEKELL